mmetsp:Transcript_60466/g.141615  ORF Transcript_60466/g.141615 Transcript_60466/m.141615 type:complete len:132 (+) Transcript_60466:112-507(+)
MQVNCLLSWQVDFASCSPERIPKGSAACCIAETSNKGSHVSTAGPPPVIALIALHPAQSFADAGRSALCSMLAFLHIHVDKNRIYTLVVARTLVTATLRQRKTTMHSCSISCSLIIQPFGSARRKELFMCE